MSTISFNPKKILGVFGLVMINVIAVDSLRSLPTTAEYGFSVVFYYIMAALFFFFPTALVAGELATTWPKTGGIYVCAKEAFEEKTAFFLVWLQWVYNICWYPTILSLMAATLAYCINPALANDHLYMFCAISGMFLLIALINCLGMKFSNYLTVFSSLFGTLIPIGFVIILGIIWMAKGNPSQITFTTKSFFPDLTNINNLGYLTAVLFSLMGMEMSAIHAQEVKNPQRDYPKALLISVILILVSFILASLAIAVVIPSQKLSLVSGLLQAYQIFFLNFKLQWLMPLIAILIVCGGAGGVSAWLLGPIKTLLVASQDGVLPKSLSTVNRFNAPYKLIIIQVIVFMLLNSAFLFMPTVSSGFWLLSDLASQLSLMFYVGLFVVAIRLRYKRPDVLRPFKVPFGNKGMWGICTAGVIACLFTIGVGFLPPPGISFGGTIRFESFLIVGIAIAIVIPLSMIKLYQITKK